MKFRPAMAMIELIFAIVIIAITVITIPVMINVAGELSKRMSIDDDVMTRLSSQMIDKFQARWGGEYTGLIIMTQHPFIFQSSIPRQT